MKSLRGNPGAPAVEVLNISAHGFWLYVNGTEFFLPFSDYPWFREAKINDMLHVELLHETHLYWPALDIDLDVESLKHPERFPLVARDASPSSPGLT